MNKTVIAETLSETTQDIVPFERKYSEGDTGELRLYLQYPISKDTLSQLESNIVSKGVVLTEPIRTDSRVLVINFKKATEPLNIISSSISGLGIETVGWQLFKDEVAKNIVPILIGVGAISLITILLITRKK